MSKFKVGQIVLFQNEEGVFIGTIGALLDFEKTGLEFACKNMEDITHLFGENDAVDTFILQEPKEK